MPDSPYLDRHAPVKPFLKWPGGKRWGASTIADMVRHHLTGTYYEPFLGGGAIFFYLRPASAVLTDLNADLINTYRQVRINHIRLIELLKGSPVSKDHYLHIRNATPRALHERAARFLYLNRTAFGGMYRLNRDGKFNVPYGGRKLDQLWAENLLFHAAQALSAAHLETSDFERIIGRALRGDVVYCDPTYTVAHDSNGFRRYNERNFAWTDQLRLAKAAGRAVTRGATVIISNAHHPSIRELYPTAECIEMERSSCVSRKLLGRKRIQEYVFVMRPKV